MIRFQKFWMYGKWETDVTDAGNWVYKIVKILDVLETYFRAVNKQKEEKAQKLTGLNY